MNDIKPARILRWLLACILIFGLISLFTNPIKAETGIITFDDLQIKNYDVGLTGSAGYQINLSRIKFDNITYQSWQSFGISPLSPEFFTFPYPFNTTTFSCQLPDSCDGFIYYDATSQSGKGAIYYVFNSISSSDNYINLSFLNPHIFDGFTSSTNLADSVAPNGTYPFKVGTQLVGGSQLTNIMGLRYISATVRTISQDNYNLTYPLPNKFYLRVNKGVASNKYNILSATGINMTIENGFNSSELNYMNSSLYGVAVNVFFQSGYSKYVVLNSTGSGGLIGQTKAIISTDKTIYLKNERINYSIEFTDFDNTDLFNIQLFKIDGSFLKTVGVNEFNGKPINNFTISDIGDYYLQVKSMNRGLILYKSSNFTIKDFSILIDSIFTDKTNYTASETVTVFGNSNADGRIIITPSSNTEYILSIIPITTGSYSRSVLRNAGSYKASLQHQSGSMWITSVSTEFNITTSISGGAKYIRFDDPENNNDGFATYGKTINVNYVYQNWTDYIRIDSPNERGYAVANISSYPYSYSFFIPHSDGAIGTWTAWIFNYSNASDFAKDTIFVIKPGTYINKNTTDQKTAIISFSNPYPCHNEEIMVSWKTQNITTVSPFFYTVRIYAATSANTMVTERNFIYESNFEAESGSLNVTFDPAGNYKIRIIQNNITYAENILTALPCIPVTVETPPAENAITFISSPMFIAILVLISFLGVGASLAGVIGAIIGVAIAVPILYLSKMIPLWTVFLDAGIVFLGVALLIAHQVTKKV